MMGPLIQLVVAQPLVGRCPPEASWRSSHFLGPQGGNEQMELGTLLIEALIVHEVPARVVRGGSPPPQLSDIECPLDDELRNFFAARMKETLASKGVDVAFADGATSPLPDLVTGLLLTTTETPEDVLRDRFVEASRRMAQHLYETQTGQNSTGLLTAVRGQIDGHRCFGILKLQKEEGARFQLQTIKGHQTFTLERIKQLMLTDSTRVFKASLFTLAQPGSETPVGLVSDEQRSHFSRREVADFFLGAFLGCRPATDPDTTTKDVFYATEDFINTGVTESGKKANYQLALLSEMNSQLGQFDPVRFAAQHFEIGDRQPYLRNLREQGLPDHTFDKDTTRIEGRIQQMRLEFEEGLKITGGRDAWEANVHVTEENGRAVARVEGQIRRVG